MTRTDSGEPIEEPKKLKTVEETYDDICSNQMVGLNVYTQELDPEKLATVLFDLASEIDKLKGL